MMAVCLERYRDFKAACALASHRWRRKNELLQPFEMYDNSMTQLTNAETADIALTRDRGPRVANPAMFFRRWLANPLQMGSVVPSSSALCDRIVRHTRCQHDEVVVELGAGTGVISRALLASGLPPDRLIVVEIVPAMAKHLRAVLPGAMVIEGDARALPKLVPPRWHGRVGTVICGIPLVLLPFVEQRLFIDAIEAVAPGRGFLLFSYCATSPLPARRHGLVAHREAWTPLNFPPASVWRYTPSATGSALS
jgi:phosphatidylethanolamine/phosphatidyl-N-methylethanolamine N-methyltransferase